MWSGLTGDMTLGLSSSESRELPADPVDLVAIDLDGTLLRTDGSICAPSAEAIMEAQEQGVKVVLASGRAPRGMTKVHDALGLKTPMVCHNGAMIYDRLADRTIYHKPLDGAVARQVIEVARRLQPTMAVAVEVYDRCFTDMVDTKRLAQSPSLAGQVGMPVAGVNSQTVEDASPVVDAAAGELASPHAEAGGEAATPPTTSGRRDPLVGSLDKLLGQPITKIMLVGESDVLGGIQLTLQERLSGQVAFACSHMQLLQVVSVEADKATAVSRVAEHYGVPQTGVMAIGDAPNDLSMIKWAGLGIAMQSGWPIVRRAAHFVVPGNDDAGVAAAIHRYALAG